MALYHLVSRAKNKWIPLVLTDGRAVPWFKHQRPTLSIRTRLRAEPYLSELRRDFLASVGITYAVFRIAKSRLRAFGEFC